MSPLTRNELIHKNSPSILTSSSTDLLSYGISVKVPGVLFFGWTPDTSNLQKKSTPCYSICHVVQSVTCLATDACLTAIPGVPSSIPARSYTFVEIDHEIISTVILLPSADSFKKGCCQLHAKVCARITG